MPPLRPSLLPLEARETPALAVLYDGASLALTGVPTAGPTEQVQVRHIGDHQYQVTDGPTALGTFRVTRDLRLSFPRFDTSATLDLAGDTLTGSVTVNVGAGDADPTTPARVSIGSTAGDAVVRGDVTVRGGSGQETYALGANTGATLTVGGSVRALGNPVTTPVEDTLSVGRRVRVRGDVVTARVTYTTIDGAVDGNVIANTVDSPGGMGFSVSGTVGGNVTAVGGATAPSANGTLYYSYARIDGTVAGDAIVRFTDGRATVNSRGTVGGNLLVSHAAATQQLNANLYGTVRGDTTARAAGNLFFDLGGQFDGDVSLFTNGTYSYGGLDGMVNGDLRFTAGPAANTGLQLVGAVGGDAVIDLGGSAGTNASFEMFDLDLFDGDGTVGGNLTVRSRAGTTTVNVGMSFEDVVFPARILGDLRLDLGDGANTFALDASATVGGEFHYTGGSGTDVVNIAGQHSFVARIRTGDGNDAVTFAPDAVVGSLNIDFGGGTDAWTPPAAVAFSTALRNLP